MSSNRVYSTEQGEICPQCNNPTTNCNCKQKKLALDSSDGIIRIRRETKGRKGAGVTIIDGLVMENDELKQLVKKIKKTCSSGGAIKDGSVEVQGEHREKVKALLEKQGYTVKLAGG